jgi:hypothetical protein
MSTVFFNFFQLFYSFFVSKTLPQASIASNLPQSGQNVKGYFEKSSRGAAAGGKWRKCLSRNEL